MTDIIKGNRVVIISGVYKGCTGEVIERHRAGEFCSVYLEVPKAVSIKTEEGFVIFKDHRTVLIETPNLLRLNTFGEVIYGENS